MDESIEDNVDSVENVDTVDGTETETSSKSKKRKQKTPHKKTPEEFRKMIVDAIESGQCTRKTAAQTFNLPYHTIVSIYKQFLDTGEVEAKKRCVFKPKKLQDEHMQFLLDTLAENCNYNIKELVELLKDNFKMEVSYNIVAKKIPAFHYSLKRINESPPIVSSPEIINENKEYSDIFLKLSQSGRLLIYFDQAEFQVTMRRFPGRTTDSELTPPPALRSRNRTIMLSMSNNEILFYKALDDTVKRKCLLDYLYGLFGVLSERNIVGAVLIVGNAAFSHCNVVKEAIQTAGHEIIFMPSKCDQFNPVETLFGQWGRLIRSKNPGNEKEVTELVETFNGCCSSNLCKFICNEVLENATKCIDGVLEYTA